MLDEIIFLEARVFRKFCEQVKVSPIEANKLFDRYGIWEYMEDAYDMLHLSSDECTIEDIIEILKVNSVQYETC